MLGIQYKHESKEDIAGFISKLVARPEYGMIYQHKGMLLQNLIVDICTLPLSYHTYQIWNREYLTFQIVIIMVLYIPVI